MKCRTLLLIFLLVAVRLPAATLVVTTFDQQPFDLSLGGSVPDNSVVATPLGSQRFARISSRLAFPGSTMSSTLDDAIGTVTFAVDGQSSHSSRPLDLRISHSDGGPFNILGYDAFEFEFSQMSGSGFLIVELGSGTGVYGASTNRIALNDAGIVTVPFGELNFGTGGSVENFLALHFTFEAESEEFSRVLDEIRLVPEPSTATLAIPSLLAVLLRRRRAGGRRFGRGSS